MNGQEREDLDNTTTEGSSKPQYWRAAKSAKRRRGRTTVLMKQDNSGDEDLTGLNDDIEAQLEALSIPQRGTHVVKLREEAGRRPMFHFIAMRPHEQAADDGKPRPTSSFYAVDVDSPGTKEFLEQQRTLSQRSQIRIGSRDSSERLEDLEDQDENIVWDVTSVLPDRPDNPTPYRTQSKSRSVLQNTSINALRRLSVESATTSQTSEFDQSGTDDLETFGMPTPEGSLSRQNSDTAVFGSDRDLGSLSSISPPLDPETEPVFTSPNIRVRSGLVGNQLQCTQTIRGGRVYSVTRGRTKSTSGTGKETKEGEWKEDDSEVERNSSPCKADRRGYTLAWVLTESEEQKNEQENYSDVEGPGFTGSDEEKERSSPGHDDFWDASPSHT